MQVSNVRDLMNRHRKASGGVGSSGNSSSDSSRDISNRYFIRDTGAHGHRKDLSDGTGGQRIPTGRQQTPTGGQQTPRAEPNPPRASPHAPRPIPSPISVEKLPKSPGPPPTKPLPPTPPLSRDLSELFQDPKALESPRPAPTPRPRTLPRKARPIAIPPCILEHELEEYGVDFKDHWVPYRADDSSPAANHTSSLKSPQTSIQSKDLKNRISSPSNFRRISGATTRDPPPSTPLRLTRDTAPIGLGIQASGNNQRPTTTMPALPPPPTREAPAEPVVQAARPRFTPTKAKLAIVEYGEYRQRLTAERKAKEAAQEQQRRREAERELREAEEQQKLRAAEQAGQKQETGQQQATQQQEKDEQQQHSPPTAQGKGTSTQSSAARTDSACSTLVPSEPDVTDWKEAMGGRSSKAIDALNEYLQSVEREHHRDILEGRIIPSRPNSE